MPKLIDYPRTTYTGAWELAEIVDDTGGKCAIDTAARKLNRKVSGSFKAIIGSAVKFGLMTSKRDLLTTTTLFKRIKHAYDKAEELQFHREAFLTPPLFTQLCRKFRNRELPVQMLDVMLIREFGVEEINAQNVAKVFADGCRMCGLLDERNTIADIDALNAIRTPRRELASAIPTIQQITPVNNTVTSNSSQPNPSPIHSEKSTAGSQFDEHTVNNEQTYPGLFTKLPKDIPNEKDTVYPSNRDIVANLFGLEDKNIPNKPLIETPTTELPHIASEDILSTSQIHPTVQVTSTNKALVSPIVSGTTYQMQVSGPAVNTSLEITEEDDIAIAIALLEKIRRQLRLKS